MIPVSDLDDEIVDHKLYWVSLSKILWVGYFAYVIPGRNNSFLEYGF
jgi:hypothetical protein